MSVYALIHSVVITALLSHLRILLVLVFVHSGLNEEAFKFGPVDSFQSHPSGEKYTYSEEPTQSLLCHLPYFISPPGSTCDLLRVRRNGDVLGD